MLVAVIFGLLGPSILRFRALVLRCLKTGRESKVCTSTQSSYFDYFGSLLCDIALILMGKGALKAPPHLLAVLKPLTGLLEALLAVVQLGVREPLVEAAHGPVRGHVEPNHKGQHNGCPEQRNVSLQDQAFREVMR